MTADSWLVDGASQGAVPRRFCDSCKPKRSWRFLGTSPYNASLPFVQHPALPLASGRPTRGPQGDAPLSCFREPDRTHLHRRSHRLFTKRLPSSFFSVASGSAEKEHNGCALSVYRLKDFFFFPKENLLAPFLTCFPTGLSQWPFPNTGVAHPSPLRPAPPTHTPHPTWLAGPAGEHSHQSHPGPGSSCVPAVSRHSLSLPHGLFACIGKGRVASK